MSSTIKQRGLADVGLLAIVLALCVVIAAGMMVMIHAQEKTARNNSKAHDSIKKINPDYAP